jgi:hypothetical protein
MTIVSISCCTFNVYANAKKTILYDFHPTAGLEALQPARLDDAIRLEPDSSASAEIHSGLTTPRTLLLRYYHGELSSGLLRTGKAFKCASLPDDPRQIWLMGSWFEFAAGNL